MPNLEPQVGRCPSGAGAVAEAILDRHERTAHVPDRRTLIRVLLVDDHAVFRSSLRLRLDHEDWAAASAMR